MGFDVIVIIGVLIGVRVILIPYHIVRTFFADSLFNVTYLFLLACSPCLLMYPMTYNGSFVLMNEHAPCNLGLVAFAMYALLWAVSWYVSNLARTSESGICREMELQKYSALSKVQESERPQFIRA